MSPMKASLLMAMVFLLTACAGSQRSTTPTEPKPVEPGPVTWDSPPPPATPLDESKSPPKPPVDEPDGL